MSWPIFLEFSILPEFREIQENIEPLFENLPQQKDGTLFESRTSKRAGTKGNLLLFPGFFKKKAAALNVPGAEATACWNLCVERGVKVNTRLAAQLLPAVS